MLGKLLKFEFWKKWKSNRYLLLGYGLVELVLLLILRVFYQNSASTYIISTNRQRNVGVSFFLIAALYFIMAGILFIYPFIEGISRYNKDLSGKQAALELMIPQPSWEKIASKLIATVCVTIICGIISAFTIVMFFFVLTNFNSDIITSVFNVLKKVFDYPAETIFSFINGLFGYASFYLLFFFCISISKWASHKNKIAVPISIGVFAATITVISYLQSLADKFPIINYAFLGMNSSLSSVFVDIFVFALTFLGTSYVMERKIEY